MAPDPKENGGALGERMDHDAVPPTGKKDAAKANNKRKKDEKNKDDDLVSRRTGLALACLSFAFIWSGFVRSVACWRCLISFPRR